MLPRCAFFAGGGRRGAVSRVCVGLPLALSLLQPDEHTLCEAACSGVIRSFGTRVP